MASETVSVTLSREVAEHFATTRTSCGCDTCRKLRDRLQQALRAALAAPQATEATRDHVAALKSALMEIVDLCCKATYSDDIHEVAGIARRALEGDVERTLAKITRARALLAEMDEARSTLATTTDLFAGMRAESTLQEAPRRALSLLREMCEIDQEPVVRCEEVNHGE